MIRRDEQNRVIVGVASGQRMPGIGSKSEVLRISNDFRLGLNSEVSAVNAEVLVRVTMGIQAAPN